ncbi:MAG: PEP-CTERM sorting domain-containing protein [Betaproteobacteria bacterium]
MRKNRLTLLSFVRHGALIGTLTAATSFPAVAAIDLGNLLSILDSTSDASWAKVSLNLYSDAWPALDDRPLNNTSLANPNGVILPWSSFAWDSNRGELILFGGGHQNYAGNEVYLWQGTTQQWTLGSLASQMEQLPTPQGAIFIPVDGAINAPTSIHTYDNNEYLAVADRFLTLGGASFNSGAAQQIENPDGTLRSTGPYLWDPGKADGTKVGGTTGSGVNPAVPGGQMWQDRDVRNLFTVTLPGGTLPVSNIDGTTAATVEGGKDVVYFTGGVGGGTDKYLFRYVIADVQDPSQDTVSFIGSWNGGPSAYGAAGIDPASGLYVAMSDNAASPFVVWDTRAAPGIGNTSHGIVLSAAGLTSFDSSLISGIDWDPSTQAFWVWSGGGSVWKLTAPASGVLTDPGLFIQETDAAALPLDGVPDNASSSGGVRGKWKYIPNLHAFMALEASPAGEVWLYRPEGWINPIPEPETYALMLAGLALVGWIARRRDGT